MSVMAPPCPLRSAGHVDLPAGPRAVAEARRLVRDAARGGTVPGGIDLDVALLLTSELVTNAVTHGSGPSGAPVALAITADAGGLRVEAHDTSLASPVLNERPSDDGEHGRGILLIDRLAADWGSYRTATGKAVYFRLAPETALAGGANQAVAA